jgi:excisionase family DNA binding protein
MGAHIAELANVAGVAGVAGVAFAMVDWYPSVTPVTAQEVPMSLSQLEILKPSASEARAARRSVRVLEGALRQVTAEQEHATIDLQGLEIPTAAARALVTILQEMAEGHPVAVRVLESTEVSTSQAAEILGVSRPTLIDLLDREGVRYRMAGTHRRIPVAEVYALKARLERNGPGLSGVTREERRERLRDMADLSDELGFGY